MDNTELIESFIQYLKATNKTVSTIIAYRKDIEQLSESNVNKNLTLFTPGDINFFLEYAKNNKKVSAKTLSRKLNSIRTFYRFLEDHNQVNTNPSLEVNHPKIKHKRPRVLTKNEYLALREVSRENDRLYAMIELLLQTGIRISELSRLKVNEINLDDPKPYMTIKGFASNPERIVPLNLKVANIINRFILANPDLKDNLFCTKTGKSIEVRNIRSSIDRALSKAEIKNACVNDLRNTFILHQLNQGVSISRIAEVVGHSNVATTTKYINLMDKKYRPNGLNEIVEL